MNAVLDESRAKSIGLNYKFELKLDLPDKNLIAHYRAKTIEEVVDKVEHKMVRLIRKYKTQHHTIKKMDKKTLAKLRRVLKRG